MADNEICLSYIPTTDMAADGLTKPLGTIKFKRFIEQLGLTDSSDQVGVFKGDDPSCGGGTWAVPRSSPSSRPGPSSLWRPSPSPCGD